MDNNTEGYKKIGKYILIRKIGQGQFATVFKAVLADKPDQLFAIKTIKKQFIQKEPKLFDLLQTEVKIMAKIKHPNILHSYDFFESDTFYYLVMDYCDQGNLENYMKIHGRFQENEAIYFLKQLMNGFKVLHKYKIIHRDIKLANIYLKQDTVIIGDFGFAKQGVEITQTRLGTPITMAPEVLTDEYKSYTNKADLWSLGIIFYQMLFNQTPYNAQTLEDLKAKVKDFSEKKFEFPNDIKISFDSMDLVSALLQYDPAKRISWSDFFNHPVFRYHVNPQEKLVNIKDSVIYRKQQEKTHYEFNTNVSNLLPTIDEEDINDEEHIRISKVVEESVPKQIIVNIKEQQEIQKNLSILNNKIFHIQKVVSFIMLTSREFKNLANLKLEIPTYTSRFLFISFLLCNKGLLMLKYTIDSLINGYNSFKISNFDEFLKLEDINIIIDQMEGNYKIYSAFQRQVYQNLEAEDFKKQYEKLREEIKHYVYQEISDLNTHLKISFNFFKDKVNLLNIPEKVNKYFKLSLIHLHFCIHSDELFPFMSNTGTFDWNNFNFELYDADIEKAFNVL